MTDLPDYVLRNREHWDRGADDWIGPGERAWSSQPSWGIWGIAETDLSLLPEDMTGMRAIELGCGTAYVSGWMSRRGASCVGIDNSERQLDTARNLSAQHGIELELIHGNAEMIPFPDESFDFAISEYGVAIWADPYKWVPEAWRVLRPGSAMSLLGNHPLVVVTSHPNQDLPATRELLIPYFGMHRVDWDTDDQASSEFHLPVSEWMRLFDEVGFDVVAYHEIQNPDPTGESWEHVTAEWAHHYPSEQAWRLRKRS